MAVRAVSVVADNIISPLGIGSIENYAAIKAGRTELKRYEGLWGLHDPFMASLLDHDAINDICKERGIEGSLTFFEKVAILSISMALEQCDIDIKSARTLLILSTTKGNIDMLRDNADNIPEERIMLGEAAKVIAEYFGSSNTPIVVSNACISGASAQIEAMRMIQSGAYDDAIVCGIDILSPFIVSGFQSLKALTDTPCRPFDEDRNGINLGEAAATIIYKGVEEDSLPPEIWLITDGAIRNDAFHISSPSPKGEGSYRALSGIMKEEDISQLAFINAHGTATLFNDEMEANAISRAGLDDVPVNSLKGYYGHTMGAAGILESIISMRAIDDNMIIGTRGYANIGVSKRINVCATATSTHKTSFLKMMSGFGGGNAALLYKKSTRMMRLATQLYNKSVCLMRPVASPSPQEKTLAEIKITPTSVILNGETLHCEANVMDMLNALYHSHIGDYPKYHKMDGLSKLGFISTELLLATLHEDRFVPREDRAVILFTHSGSIEVDQRYQNTISDADNFYPSPSLFVYTLPNIVTGEIAMRNKYLGETLLYVIPQHPTPIIPQHVTAALSDGITHSVIAGSIDYYDKDNFQAEIKLTSQYSS